VTMMYLLLLSSIMCQSSSNSSNSSNSSATNSTSSNSTSTNGTAASTNSSAFPSIITAAWESAYCYNTTSPEGIPDCQANGYTYQYIACCFLTLTNPYVGNTCTPLDLSQYGQNFTNFTTTIYPNTSMTGSLYCDSSYAKMNALLYSFVILIAYLSSF